MEENPQTSNLHSGAEEKTGGRTRQSAVKAAVGQATSQAARTDNECWEDDAHKRAPHLVEALTREMMRGKDEAFREFYDAYFDRLLRYLLVVTGGNEQAAREALQATLLRLVRHVKVFDTEEKFWNWLTVLARSALTDEFRKQRRWFAFLERFSRHAETENPSANDYESEAKLCELLEKSVSSLPSDEQELIALKYFSHRSVREIANGHGTTEKAVESKLSRIRLKLKNTIFAKLKNEPRH